jgi:hypothetical protein
MRRGLLPVMGALALTLVPLAASSAAILAGKIQDTLVIELVTPSDGQQVWCHLRIVFAGITEDAYASATSAPSDTWRCTPVVNFKWYNLATTTGDVTGYVEAFFIDPSNSAPQLAAESVTRHSLQPITSFKLPRNAATTVLPTANVRL